MNVLWNRGEDVRSFLNVIEKKKKKQNNIKIKVGVFFSLPLSLCVCLVQILFQLKWFFRSFCIWQIMQACLETDIHAGVRFTCAHMDQCKQ